MRVKLLQTGEHAAWQEGEIVTVQIVAVDDAGAYECETLETYAPDLKEKHAQQLVDLTETHNLQHEQAIAELQEQHAKEIEQLTAKAQER